MVAAAKLQRHVGRKRAGRFLAEGPNLVEAALRRGLVSEVFATEAALDRFGALLDGAPVSVVTEKAAKALSETVTPVGLVAVCALPESSLESVLATEPRLLAVAVGMSEPGNAGTLIRIADAMGADAVVFAGHSVDPYNGKCLRSSAGSIFSLPVVVDPDAAAVVSEIRGSGIEVLATALDASVDIRAADLSARTAWLFGPEAHGLPADLVALASQRVHIPMRGSAESLNVAAAASICLYESSRAHS
ncbi:TrmH family RNA methyltransferase [Mycolicibacterium llatzerense]|uniref:TrmH family RNA methyltransferase n=1 Tax=Mycolicibacterium llatzerense TaxID=280871 RepID=UPI0021B6A072|nr:RNA methyltransferase [Mycolicibacterium llatzerense]MCT7372262.1 RNA methyltransferase [Mycolicibacterium llatzerense]